MRFLGAEIADAHRGRTDNADIANTIRFRQIPKIKKSADKESPETTQPHKPCDSPIIIERLEKEMVLIAFHKCYFNISILGVLIKHMTHGVFWTINHTAAELIPQYESYIVKIHKSMGDKTEDLLQYIVDSITKMAYQEELQTWFTEISELVKPRQFTLWDGANISAKTKSVLTSAGFQTISDLLAVSREELCCIPGMTTEAIVKLEKSLASHFYFLNNRIPDYKTKMI